MHYLKKLKLTTAGFGLVATLSATGVAAETLNYAIGFPPGGAATDGIKEFNELLSAEGDVKLKVFELSLLNLKETAPGVRDGLADAGYVITAYYPAEFSEINLPAEMSMLTNIGTPPKSSGAVMAGVITEYAMLHCLDCQAQFKRENQVFLGAMGTSEYVSLCTSPIRAAEDLKGKKMRSSIAAMGRWAESFGGTKVSLPANDIYEAMSQGVVDCAMISAPELGNLQLFDVTKYITLNAPGGSFSGVGALNVNLDTWHDMSAEDRARLIAMAPYNTSYVTVNYSDNAATDLEKATEMGVEIIEAPQALRDATEAFVTQDIELIKTNFANDYGLQNVDEKVEIIIALIEKWKGLTDGIYNDKDALAQVYAAEIFSKVAPDTYYMD
ncbi:lactate-binding periplasmic protein (plasmid) [Pseudosulfitobacter pseudonitzschiae]|jgi:TRAP-type C4-dicarboxylate transport system substrate-binding protein|uniref:Lactate-binding periplasmic protein n=1 Tax=Pseudosulfitobacter pseudonitzschiae TaxID=1402135 RepID=A0A221K8H3_9RHOB|nr:MULTISPECIES: C4-dicarboxylate TRAP transporter substrate-binding protein [Roseobacteraceae]ASM75302.1 lactate-binding periplasmic protein [Pseudosulfitobacter pseudonitzschiae]|tara:strand:+ start:8820 stop:9971 length:1152 start_codon:yes stop_codon:yes gene_type:complete